MGQTHHDLPQQQQQQQQQKDQQQDRQQQPQQQQVSWNSPGLVVVGRQLLVDQISRANPVFGKERPVSTYSGFSEAPATAQNCAVPIFGESEPVRRFKREQGQGVAALFETPLKQVPDDPWPEGRKVTLQKKPTSPTRALVRKETLRKIPLVGDVSYITKPFIGNNCHSSDIASTNCNPIDKAARPLPTPRSVTPPPSKVASSCRSTTSSIESSQVYIPMDEINDPAIEPQLYEAIHRRISKEVLTPSFYKSENLQIRMSTYKVQEEVVFENIEAVEFV
jgi:hypothetical protein